MIDLVTEPRSQFVKFFVLPVLLDRDDEAFRGCGVGGRGAVENEDDCRQFDDRRATRENWE